MHCAGSDYGAESGHKRTGASLWGPKERWGRRSACLELTSKVHPRPMGSEWSGPRSEALVPILDSEGTIRLGTQARDATIGVAGQVLVSTTAITTRRLYPRRSCVNHAPPESSEPSPGLSLGAGRWRKASFQRGHSVRLRFRYSQVPNG